jgi:hypothetical protein
VRRYRIIYISLGLALAAVVAFGVAFGSPDRPGTGRPDQVEGVSPEPGETALRQTRIEVDLAAGYALELYVDGLRIPDEELFVVEGTGVYSWQPGPDQIIDALSPGQHQVMIRWRTLTGLPDEGEYSWTFRAY